MTYNELSEIQNMIKSCILLGIDIAKESKNEKQRQILVNLATEKLMDSIACNVV